MYIHIVHFLISHGEKYPIANKSVARCVATCIIDIFVKNNGIF